MSSTIRKTKLGGLETPEEKVRRRRRRRVAVMEAIVHLNGETKELLQGPMKPEYDLKFHGDNIT